MYAGNSRTAIFSPVERQSIQVCFQAQRVSINCLLITSHFWVEDYVWPMNLQLWAFIVLQGDKANVLFKTLFALAQNGSFKAFIIDLVHSDMRAEIH